MARILLVDDDVHFRTMLRITCERAGFEVIEAEDGDAALESFRSANPDLVVTDIVMPGKQGLELIADLRRECPHSRIIAMSGGGHANPYSYLSMAKGSGVDAVFVKPLNREDFLAKVRELTGEAELSHEGAP